MIKYLSSKLYSSYLKNFFYVTTTSLNCYQEREGPNRGTKGGIVCVLNALKLLANEQLSGKPSVCW